MTEQERDDLKGALTACDAELSIEEDSVEQEESGKGKNWKMTVTLNYKATLTFKGATLTCTDSLKGELTWEEYEECQ